MTDHFNELSKLLKNLGRRHGLSKVFNDLLTVTICSYHSVNMKNLMLGLKPEDFEIDTYSEGLYYKIIEPYSNEELCLLAKAMGQLQLNVNDNPYSDILGEYFTQEITNGQNGQFFTPESVCTMMAQMTVPENMVKKKILDPACGSGRTLIKAAELNPDNYFFGADNDVTCAKMATVNFFMNGLKGEVSWMNSLSMEWYCGWHINMQAFGIIPIEKEQSYIWANAPETKPESPEGEQLTFF